MKFKKTIIAFVVFFAVVASPKLCAQGWDWGVSGSGWNETGGDVHVPRATMFSFAAIELPEFGILSSRDSVLAGLNTQEIIQLKKLLTDIISLNYKLSESFEEDDWKGFVVGRLFAPKSHEFLLKVDIKGNLNELLRKYTQLITLYEDLFDTICGQGSQPFKSGDFMKAIWGEGKFLERPDLIIGEVRRNVMNNNSTSIMKWIIYYMDFIIPQIEQAGRDKKDRKIKDFDPMWDLKQQNYSDALDTWGNFWSDMYSDTRMFGEPPQIK
jgi:hypothetical protein